MTDRTQFEAMLEALINDNQEEAKDIFHNIVVAKSREIYEELLSEDFDSSEEDEDEEETHEAFGDSNDEPEDDDSEESDDDDVGGDATDDFIDDTDGESDFDSEDDGEESDDIEDRVMDLEDALEELKAEFEELMAGEENEPEHSDMFGGEEEPEMGDEFGPAEPEMGDEFGGEEEPMDEFSMFMEYVNKVALPKHGDDGANTKSIVAKKNDMGGTAANIAKSFSTEKGGTQGGLLNPSSKEENFGNINVPGGNAGKSAFKKKEPGHGAEKKGAGESAADKNSLIGSRK